jgi:hypothetical protein
MPIAFRMPLNRETEKLLHSYRSSSSHLTHVRCAKCATTYVLATSKVVDQNGIERHVRNVQQEIGPCLAHYETVFI